MLTYIKFKFIIENMKIALCSAENIDNDIDFNLAQIELFIKKTKKEKPDLLLFGEAFLQGFDSICFEYKKDIKIAVSVNDELITKIRKLTSEAGTAIGFGFIENDHGVIFSSYLIVDKDGKNVDKYQRVSTGWRIRNTCADYREGKNFHKFKFKDKTFAVLLCGDFWEDYLLEKIIDINPDIFLWPVFCSYKKEDWECSQKKDYSERTAILDKPMLFVNSLITENGKNYGGGAYIWHYGNILQEIPMGKIGYLIFDC